jgi:hypothetical protein
MITLVTLTQGNPIALKRTIDNVVQAFQGKVDQVVIGNLCVFDKDKFGIHEADYGVKLDTLFMPFNHLFEYGFGATLNKISTLAINDLCLYMNVSEIVDSPVNLSIIHPQWNSYKFDHAIETHKWCRLWNRKQLTWSGRIHEIVVEGAGQKYTAPDMLFTMADTPKDDADPFYSAVMNTVKEYVYWNQYLMLVDDPSQIGGTDQGWVKYAKDSYEHIKGRMYANPERLQAFRDGDLEKFLYHCKDLPHHQNDHLVHYQ